MNFVFIKLIQARSDWYNYDVFSLADLDPSKWNNIRSVCFDHWTALSTTNLSTFVLCLLEILNIMWPEYRLDRHCSTYFFVSNSDLFDDFVNITLTLDNST